MNRVVTSAGGVSRLARRPEHILTPYDFGGGPFIYGWYDVGSAIGLPVGACTSTTSFWAGQTVGDYVLDMYRTIHPLPYGDPATFSWVRLLRFPLSDDHSAADDAKFLVKDDDGYEFPIDAVHVGGCGCDFIDYLSRRPSDYQRRKDQLLEQMRTGAWLPPCRPPKGVSS